MILARWGLKTYMCGGEEIRYKNRPVREASHMTTVLESWTWWIRSELRLDYMGGVAAGRSLVTTGGDVGK